VYVLLKLETSLWRAWCHQCHWLRRKVGKWAVCRHPCIGMCPLLSDKQIEFVACVFLSDFFNLKHLNDHY
jgi:hypothetical protein